MAQNITSARVCRWEGRTVGWRGGCGKGAGGGPKLSFKHNRPIRRVAT